jgi:hypothetical protein
MEKSSVDPNAVALGAKILQIILREKPLSCYSDKGI